jgi:hypothetical protein
VSPFYFNFIYKAAKKITWTTVVIKAIKGKKSSIYLILATFFNPFGFDLLFAAITKWTGSYLITDIIFYSMSGLFFGLYFLSKNQNKDK